MQNRTECPFKNILEPKGPKGLPMVHSFPFVAWNVLDFLANIRATFGDIAQYKIFGIRNYLVSNPEDIAQVLKEEKQGEYTKKRFHDAFSPLFGNGLLNSDGSIWDKQRKQLQPFFQKTVVAKWFPIVAEEAILRLQLINDSTGIKSEDDIQVIIQGIMSRILFGVKPDNDDSKDLIRAIDLASEKLLDHALKSYIFKGFLNKLPTPSNRKYKKALATIYKGIRKLSADKNIQEKNALLPLFSKMMSPKELRDQLFTFYFAGQDTTKNAILWTFYNLAKHPESQKKARSEVLEKWPTLTAVNYNDLDGLDYINAVIDESMRLFPPAYVIPRDIEKDVSFKGHLLQEKGVLVLSPYVTHRHPDYWENPNEYQPERFLNKNREKRLSFFPFGAGMRICIGMHLAKMEMTTIVALFVASFEFSLEPPNAKIKPAPFMTLRPKNGVPLSLKSTGYLRDKK